MIDIHSHILPNLDDGENDVNKLLEIIKQMSQNGVKTVFATPHYLEGMYNNSSIDIKNALMNLKKLISENSISLEVKQGCEVYLTPTSHEDIIRENYCYEGTNYCLVECNVNSLESDVYRSIYHILRKGFRPILAHPERYRFIMNSTRAARELIEKDILLQVNSGSILGIYGKSVKNTAWKLLNSGKVHFIASDTHAKEIEYNLKIAYDKVVEHIDETTAELLFKIFPQKMMNNESIPKRYVDVKTPRKHKRGFFGWF